MKLIRTIQKLIEESEKDYFSACDRCADEQTLRRLEKNYQDSMNLMKKIDKLNIETKKK